VIPFPFRYVSLILSLSLLHSSFAPVLTLLLLRTRSLFFTFFTLCELREKRVTSINELQVARSDSFRKSMSWAFYFAYVGHTLCSCVEFFILSILFIFFYLLPLSLSFFSFSHYAFGCVDTLCSFDGTSDHFSRPDAWHFISFFVACVRSHPVCSFFSGPSRYLSSEVRCASLRIVMPPLLNRPSVGYVLRVQCVFDVETQVVTMVSFCCYFAIDVLWHSATRNRFAVSSKEGACTRCQKEPFFLSTHRVIAPH